MTIFKTLSNLKHSDKQYQKGDLFEGDLSEFESLVKDGVLAVVKGADSIDEAKAALKEQGEQSDSAEEEKEMKPQDTWAPTNKDEDTWGPKENESTETTGTEPVENKTTEGEKKDDIVDPSEANKVLPPEDQASNIS